MWRSRIGIDGVHGGTRRSFLGLRRRRSVLVLGGIPHLLGSGSVVVAEVPARTLWTRVKKESMAEEGTVLAVAAVKGIISEF